MRHGKTSDSIEQFSEQNSFIHLTSELILSIIKANGVYDFEIWFILYNTAKGIREKLPFPNYDEIIKSIIIVEKTYYISKFFSLYRFGQNYNHLKEETYSLDLTKCEISTIPYAQKLSLIYYIFITDNILSIQNIAKAILEQKDPFLPEMNEDEWQAIEKIIKGILAAIECSINYSDETHSKFLEIFHEIKFINLSNSNLERICLIGPDKSLPMKNRDFRKAIFLNNAAMKQANLSSTNLANVDFEFSNLEGANLELAILTGANIRNTNLHGANLHGVRFLNSHVNASTLLKQLDELYKQVCDHQQEYLLRSSITEDLIQLVSHSKIAQSDKICMLKAAYSHCLFSSKSFATVFFSLETENQKKISQAIRSLENQNYNEYEIK